VSGLRNQPQRKFLAGGELRAQAVRYEAMALVRADAADPRSVSTFAISAPRDGDSGNRNPPIYWLRGRPAATTRSLRRRASRFS
jgi:hypothetical protein